MRANLFFAGLCALALAATACSVEETVQVTDANAITFKATASYATRAAATTTNNLNSFTVWGWTESRTIMDRATATRESGGSVYSTSPTCYWPGDAVDFLALSPAADASLYNETTGTSYMGEAYSGYEVLTDGEEAELYTGHVAEAAVEPLVGTGSVRVNVPEDCADQIDLCYAYTPDKTSGTVTMNFRHALSQVAFAARTTNADQEIRIRGVSVCSVHNWGTYTLPFATTETNLPAEDIGTGGIAESQGSWTLGPAYNGTQFPAELALGTDGYITVPNDNSAVTLSADGSSLFLLPQEVDGWNPSADRTLDGIGAYFRVDCAIVDSDGSLVWPNEEERNGDDSMEYAEIAVPVDVVWDEGYKYTYTFVFGEGAGYYPPDDEVDPGEAIPFTPIRFDVNAGEFQTTEGTDVEPAVQIDYYDYIVDEKFLNYMQKFDRNGDGHLYYDELEYIEEIECNTAEDFTGIEYYYNLKKFTSNSAKCTSISFEKENEPNVLDLSNNTNLWYVCFNTNKSTTSNTYSAPVKHVVLTGTNITEIGEYAFCYCTDLTTVELPDCLEVIGASAFRSCTGLTSITLPENMISIGNYAFGKSGLHSISIPDKVTSIGNDSFSQCSDLTTANLSSALETIGSSAFWECNSLTSISIPANVESIGDKAFYECYGLKYVTFSTPLTATSMTIGNYAFSDCDVLETIEIPEGVVSIGERAFESCNYMTTVKLPSTLTTLGKYAFQTCKYLTAIEIPGGVEELNGYTFREDSALASVTLNEGLQSIGASDFYACFGIESIVIPSTVTSMGGNAFYACANMVSMTVLATTPPTIETSTFNSIKSSAVLYVPSESISAYENAGWGSYFGGGIEAISD